MGFFFEEIFHIAKTTEFSLKGDWRTKILFPQPVPRAPHAHAASVRFGAPNLAYNKKLLGIVHSNS